MVIYIGTSLIKKPDALKLSDPYWKVKLLNLPLILLFQLMLTLSISSHCGTKHFVVNKVMRDSKFFCPLAISQEVKFLLNL